MEGEHAQEEATLLCTVQSAVCVSSLQRGIAQLN